MAEDVFDKIRDGIIALNAKLAKIGSSIGNTVKSDSNDNNGKKENVKEKLEDVVLKLTKRILKIQYLFDKFGDEIKVITKGTKALVNRIGGAAKSVGLPKVSSGTAAGESETAAGSAAAGEGAAEAGAGAGEGGAAVAGIGGSLATGLIIGAIVIAVVAALGILAKSITDTTAKFLESQKELAKFSSTLAVSYANAKISDIRRNITTASATGGATADLQQSYQRLLDALLPIKIVLTNLISKTLTKLTDLVTGGINGISGILEWLNIFGNKPKDKKSLPDNQAFQLFARELVRNKLDGDNRRIDGRLFPIGK